MKRIALTVLSILVLIGGLIYAPQPAQSQSERQGAGATQRKTGSPCGGQGVASTALGYPGIVVNGVTFDLADVGAFPGDGGLYPVEIAFGAESQVPSSSAWSGVSYVLDAPGPAGAINVGPQYFDNSPGPGWGTRTNINTFVFGTGGVTGTFHTVNVTLWKQGGAAGSVSVFWRCTTANFSNLQS